VRREVTQQLDVEVLAVDWEIPGTPPVDARRTEASLLTQPFNDYGNAQRLIAMHGQNLRYCHGFRKWLAWDGRRWAIDESDLARKMSQEAMLEFARQALARGNEEAAKFSGRCLNSQRISSALHEAQPHLAITPSELDAHAHLLNFANGTVDLRTGQFATHDRNHFITKLVHSDYATDAVCPVFLRFLQRILGDELMPYVQKAFGYSLTGSTAEKVVFMCLGKGDNGKTTLLSLFLLLLREYAVLLQIDTLMVRQESNNTQADLADLRGARFVMTSETEQGQRLAEGKLKRITQGMGKIKATRKYENPIEFDETHKLWMDANHKPEIRGTDNAIWNRLHLIPFDVTIPKEEIDRRLPMKLAAEAPGILRWAVEGAVRWHDEGLGKPELVEAAGKEWRKESDQIGQFIRERCVTGEFSQAKARGLYLEYKHWAEEAGEKVATETAFGSRVTDLGYEKKRGEAGATYRGIGLAANPDGLTGSDG
jgi:putative DNA primase/helicase